MSLRHFPSPLAQRTAPEGSAVYWLPLGLVRATLEGHDHSGSGQMDAELQATHPALVLL